MEQIRAIPEPCVTHFYKMFLSSMIHLNVDALIENEAALHKSCHLQISKSKLNKAKERAARKRRLNQAKPEEEKATKTRILSSSIKAGSIAVRRFARAGGAGFENLLTRA